MFQGGLGHPAYGRERILQTLYQDVCGSWICHRTQCLDRSQTDGFLWIIEYHLP